MVTTIIVVDSLIDDVLYNTLSFLKKTSCYIVKLDLYSVTKENIHVKLHEYIAEEMESQIMNISKILFVNFNINENNIETELFLGEKSKLFNLETHDSSFKSWNFVNEIVVNLSKSFLIENVDFLDINHLIFYNSYKAPLKHVEEAASINESFKANVNYLTKYVTSEESEILKTSTNWLNTLLGPMYSQNVQLKEFIDLYFQVNNSNLNFLANQNIEYLDIFSKKFVEIKQNNVLLNETTTSVNVMLIPLQLYGEDGDKLLDVIEMVKKDTCYICFINEEDDVETINKILSNIANTACNFSSGTSIDMNLCIHVDYASIKNGQFDLAEEIPTIDLNNSSTANTLVSILDSLNNNSKLKSVKASITNIYESESEKSLLFCEELMSNYQDGKVTFILERTRNTYDDILYKPEEFASLSFISHQEIYSENNVTKDINVPFLLNFINESSYDDFVTKTTLNQLILYDASLSKFLPEVYASLTPDTEILVYHSTETFSILKDKISQLKNNYGSSLNNVALFKKNMPSTHFSLFEEEKSLKYDVLEDSSEWNDELIIDPSGEDDVSLQELDVSMEEDAHNAETIYPEGHLEQEKEIYYSHYNGPDPSLNTWQKFSDFLSYLQDDIEVSNFDILTCKLVGPDWEYILETLQEKTPNMTIHSSIDTTGHVLFEGDWILETPKNVNLVGLYFNKNIYDVKVELDSTIFSSMYILHLKIRDYIKVSTHQSVVDDVGDISTWIIHSNLKTFRDGNRGLFYYAIHSTGDYKIEKDWSKLDDISGWDVSHMTDFYGAFAGPSSHGLLNNYNAKFNSPIGSWDVANVTNMSSAFSNAVLFDQDLSEWDTIKVGNMTNMFYNAWSFNQDISGWNVSNVTTLDYTFYAARRFNQSLAGWDTVNVTSMNGAFQWARSFDQDLSTWDVGNVTQFQFTFTNARSFTQVLGGSWKNVPPQVQDNTITNGIRTKQMFCGSNDDFKNIPTGHIEVDYDPAVGFTSLNQLKHAFYIDAINSLYAESLFGKMRDWDVSKITSLDGLCTIVDRRYHTIEMEDWNVSNVTSMEKTFFGKVCFQCDLRKWDTVNVTNMEQMFYNCSRFNSDISGWDTTNVTDMRQMFYNCQRLRYDLTSWDTTNADTTNMFQNATYYNDSIINSTFVPNYSLPVTTFTTKSELTTAVNAWKTNRENAQNTYGHISKWNVSTVTDFSSLFTGIAGAFFHENLNEWDTSNVTDMREMFYRCTNVSVLIGDWTTSNVTSLNNAFCRCYYFIDDLSGWDVGNVTDMDSTFMYALSFNGNIEGWEVGKVTTMYNMFHTANYFNRDLTSWDIENVTQFRNMFTNAEGINRVFKGKWMDLTERLPTASLLGMVGTVYRGDHRLGIGFKNNGANMNSNHNDVLRQNLKLYVINKKAALLHYPEISQWNISNIDNFDNLFHAVYAVTLDISGWDVSHVTSMNYTFTGNHELDIDFSSWNVDNVKSFVQTFNGCTYSEIKGVEEWTMQSATNIASMFAGCHLFNRDISSWNVTKTTAINGMFSGCKYFNKDLSKWKLDSISVWSGVSQAFNHTYNYNVVLGQTWTVLHDQINSTDTGSDKTLAQYIAYVFNNTSPGTVSDIPYNAAKMTFTSTDISNNIIYENDEIVMNLVVDISVNGIVGTDDLEITNGVIKNFNKISELEYTFIFTATTSGTSSQVTANPNSSSPLGYFAEEPFVWTWFPATPGVELLGLYAVDYDSSNQVKVFKSGTGVVTASVDSSWRKFPIVEVDANDPGFYNNVYEVTWSQPIYNNNQHGGYVVEYDSTPQTLYGNTGQGPVWWWFSGNKFWATKYPGGHYEYNTSDDYRLSNTIRFKFTSPTTWECVTDSSGSEATYSYTNSSNFDGVVKIFYFVHYLYSSSHTLTVTKKGASSANFNSPTISNNSTYENDEIVMNLVVDASVSESIGPNDLQITNGTVKNFYQKSELEYRFIFTSSNFGQSSQITVNPNSSSLSDYVVEESFEWTWSPPITVITFNSPDISNNQTQTSSSIDVEINLSREFLTNEQLIQNFDISMTNGVITGFQRVNDTQYIFTFIASSPNVSSVIEMANHFDASNTILPSSFTWTWSATIEQPVLTISSVDVNNNDIIKKNEIDMLLTYTPNRKLAFASLTETDISFTNGFIVNNSFVKKTPTQYSFRFRSLSRDTNSTIYIPQNQFQYNFVDGATNLTENYEGSSTFTWKYNGLDIPLTNNKTVAVITSEQKESKSLDLILHGNVTYDPVYNEYEFEKSTSDYITISGEVLNGLGEASISFWYKTKTTANTSFATLLTLRNDDNDNYTLQRYSTQDKFHIKSTGSGTINTTTTNLPYYNTNYVHMVVTFTATEILVYKNSVLEETHSVSNIIAGGERTFQMIGASVTSANAVYRYFNGYIKNLRFYNYAVPSTEVSALYTMYNTGMNDTVPQILGVNLTTTDTLSNNEFPKATINMEMDVTYDSVASISSIDNQTFIIDKSNFDTSFGYVFDFKQLSETKVSFKFGASTTIHNSQLFLKQDTITRTINSNLNVVANPESNVFTWKYKSEPLTIQTIKSNIGDTGSLTNQDVIWIQVIFSEEVFNFRKHYITGTNCKVIKTTGSGTRYAVKVQTFRPTGASIVIDIPSSLPITTGKGLNKALADANNTTYNWQYHNVVPTFTIVTSQESGLTNNADYVDITLVTSTSTTNFDINSLNLNGSAEIVNFSGSGQNYSYRLQPFASSAISLTLPSGAFSDEYGNKNTSSHTFNWTYHNIKPEVYIASQDINSGDSADIGSIETYFVFSKAVSGLSLADVDTTNGNLSDLTETTTFPEHEITYTVTVDTKTSSNSYYNRGSSNAFFLNGEEAKVISFVVGNTYTFNNASNSAHPLKFYTDAEKTSGSEYTTGVTVSSTSTIIVVDSNTPTTIYYQCEAHEYMGNIITYGQSYKATLIPASSSVTISLEIADNSVKDDLDIFNDVASNSFVWNYTGTEYMVSIESPDLKSGASHLYKSIQVILTLTYTTFDDVDVSIFTIVNGTVPSILNNGDGTYTFTLESISSNTETSILLPENSVTRSDGNDKNKESNKFTWTYNPPIPKLTLTSSYVKEGAFTNNSSIDLQLDFTEDVVFDVNTINITNASGTLSGSNNSYVLTVVPDIIADSSADILVSFPEDTGFYNLFDNENLYNDTSYNYSWKYDSVIPTGTIVSSISEFIYQDVCSNIQSVPFTIQFNKNIPSLETNDFTVSSNGALSGLSGSDSLYSFVISALDNTIDNTISFKVGDDAITDEAGNYFSSSNEFSFTITAKVSKVLETAAIAELFTDDADIAEEDKLSSDEINMVLAIEIPDLTVPDFDEVEGGEVSVDLSYTVTVDTKTSSNSYYSQGSSSAYYIDGAEALSLALDQNNVYRFNQDDSTNSGHPLLFYEDLDKSVQYTTDISVNGTPGSAGAYTQISITSDTPSTLYYQCGNHGYMGGIITVGEVDTIPVVTLPASVTITNSKVFTRLIDQILEMADDITAIKMSLDDVAMSETATEKIPQVEQVIMAKSNQIEPPVVIEDTGADSVLFVPLANEGDLVKVEINGVAYLTVVNSDNTFSLNIDGVVATGSPFSKDDVYLIDDTNSIIFGSQIISSSPPPQSPPTVDMTSSVVQNGATTTTGTIDIDLSFSTTVEIDLTNIYTLTNDTEITSSSIQSVDGSNSIVVVSVSPILPDVSAELGIVIYETTFYSTLNSVDYYNDVSFSFSWNYDATAYNSANVVEVVEEYEPLFIDPTTGFIPCFLKDTNILTTKGYKKVQDLIPGKDMLIDHKNNIIECLEVKKYVKQNDGKEYPHRIPCGSQLSKEFICDQDLFLTYNHCIYLPNNDMFAPVSLMKHIKQHVTNDPYFVYYHVFTSNYFSDTIIANGIPCETHSKYAFNYLRGLDSSGKLLKKVIEKTNMLPNCRRNRISRKKYNKLVNKFVKNKNKYRK